MRFTKITIIGSIMSWLLATAVSAQTTATAPTLNNVRVINSTSPAQVVYAENMYAYSTGDTVKQQDLKSKEISQEINMPKGGEIYIENSSLAIQVKIWDQPKVKLVTTAYFEKESTLTDTEWFEKMGISLKAIRHFCENKIK